MKKYFLFALIFSGFLISSCTNQPEIIAAKHVGMKVLCLSLMTNKVVVEETADTVHATHEEVLAAVQTSGKHVEAIVKKLIDANMLGDFLEKCPIVSYVPSKATSGTNIGEKVLDVVLGKEDRVFKALLLGGLCYLSYAFGRKAAN